jgi:solute:Na+ symporter, SSS family
MTTAVLLANNLYRAINPAADDSSVAKLAKLLVPAIAVIAVFFTLRGGQTIVALLLMGYSSVTRMFPALVLSLTSRRRWVTREGASCGIVVGVATVAVTSLRHVSIGTLFPSLLVATKELNVGIIALTVNFLVLILVSGAVRLGKAREHRLTADTSPS